MEQAAISRYRLDSRLVDNYYHPYTDMPTLDSHLAPPLAVINGGGKCEGVDFDNITTDLALKGRLELLGEIWEFIKSAEEDAKSWGRKRPREKKEDEEEEDSNASRRITRSQFRRDRETTDSKVEEPLGRKRKAESSLCGTMLTERTVIQLSKRQKTSDFRTEIRRWAESIGG